MIIRHSINGISRCRTALKPSRLNDTSRPAYGIRRARAFHASTPKLIVSEALQLSSAALHLVHDSSGLTWGLSIPLTASLWQLAFTSLHYWVERNKDVRAQAATLLEGYKSAYQQQLIAQRDSEGTEAEAASADSHLRKKLKAKNKQLQAELGYSGNWLNYTVLTYVAVWISNNTALLKMCGLKEEEDSKILSASGTNEIANEIATEPALTTEGMMWFTDLTVADPLCILPIATGGLFVTTVLQAGRARTGPPTSLQKFMTVFAVLSGPIFIAVGTSNAILLAMVGSSLVTIIRRSMLDRLFGKSIAKVKPVKPKTAVLKTQYLQRG